MSKILLKNKNVYKITSCSVSYVDKPSFFFTKIVTLFHFGAFTNVLKQFYNSIRYDN